MRKATEILMIELDAEGAAFVVDRHRFDERSVPRTEILEEMQAAPGRPSKLRMVTLPLELGEDDEGQHDLVLREAGHRQRIGQEYGGVDDENRAVDQGIGDASPLRRARRGR